ncbi:hypothetical protein BW716_33360 [[Flexibacter] sp. ATCC 35208]|nr:hypothetical protein BW716_33360 [[Flexibacter] sp. ATCC 35208]
MQNKNVSRATVSLSQFGNTVGYSYRYDQLNRLKRMRQHPLTIGATLWDASTAGTAYQEDVTYDANGNIMTYNRNGSGANGKQAAMDKLIYGYNRDASGYLLNNQLAQVKDDISTTDYSTDVKSQSDNNYGYDKIGNLVKDVQAGISDITWTVEVCRKHLPRNSKKGVKKNELKPWKVKGWVIPASCSSEFVANMEN